MLYTNYYYSGKIKFSMLREKTFFLLIVLLSLIMGSCENDISKVKTIISTEEPAAITIEGVEMLASDSAVIRFKLQTPQLIYHKDEKDPYYEFPKGVKIVKYDANMKVISSITSQYAKNFASDDRWEAKNNVIAVNFKGDTLKTEYLVWDTKNKKIYSDQFVKIIQKDKVLTGIGFESNQDFSSYHIKNLKGNMYVNVDK